MAAPNGSAEPLVATVAASTSEDGDSEKRAGAEKPSKRKKRTTTGTKICQGTGKHRHVVMTGHEMNLYPRLPPFVDRPRAPADTISSLSSETITDCIIPGHSRPVVLGPQEPLREADCDTSDDADASGKPVATPEAQRIIQMSDCRDSVRLSPSPS